jgi:hypothetical protein
MPEQNSSNTPASPKRIPTEALVALFGLIGVVITAYFGYLQARLPYEAQATRDAQAADTESALAHTQTALFLPTATSTLIATPSPTQAQATFTFTPASTPTTFGQPVGEKYCINVRSVYVREGPGSDFGALGGLTFEDCLYFDTRVEYEVQVESEDNATLEKVSWLRVSPSQPMYLDLVAGWVRADLLRPDDYTLLPVITLTPTITPSPEPSATLTPLG